jgi:O-6-methylguanine DNA methyltransferase
MSGADDAAPLVHAAGAGMIEPMSVSLLDRPSQRGGAPAAAPPELRVDRIDSPVGPLVVACGPRGLCRLSFAASDSAVFEALATTPGATVGPLAEVRAQLREYFAGERRVFDLALELDATGFTRAVLDELARVPYGQLESYGSLAARAGYPGAARAVGGVMNRNPIAIVLPCHRIVGADGSLTGFGGGLDVKRALLEREGALLSAA